MMFIDMPSKRISNFSGEPTSDPWEQRSRIMVTHFSEKLNTSFPPYSPRTGQHWCPGNHSTAVLVTITLILGDHNMAVLGTTALLSCRPQHWSLEITTLLPWRSQHCCPGDHSTDPWGPHSERLWWKLLRKAASLPDTGSAYTAVSSSKGYTYQLRPTEFRMLNTGSQPQAVSLLRKLSFSQIHGLSAGQAHAIGRLYLELEMTKARWGCLSRFREGCSTRETPVQHRLWSSILLRCSSKLLAEQSEAHLCRFSNDTFLNHHQIETQCHTCSELINQIPFIRLFLRCKLVTSSFTEFFIMFEQHLVKGKLEILIIFTMTQTHNNHGVRGSPGWEESAGFLSCLFSTTGMTKRTGIIKIIFITQL